jgi:hypothetical protein
MWDKFIRYFFEKGIKYLFFYLFLKFKENSETLHGKIHHFAHYVKISIFERINCNNVWIKKLRTTTNSDSKNNFFYEKYYLITVTNFAQTRNSHGYLFCQNVAFKTTASKYSTLNHLDTENPLFIVLLIVPFGFETQENCFRDKMCPFIVQSSQNRIVNWGGISKFITTLSKSI